MTNHLEVPFDNNGIFKNATGQLDRNGAYITIENGPTVFVERRSVGEFVRKWNEMLENP